MAQTLKIYHLPINPDYVIVHWKVIDKRVRKIFMAPITEEDEKLLDDKDRIFVEINGRNVKLTSKDVICYGAVDFDFESSDMMFLRDLEYMISDGMRGVSIPARYNYKNHTAVGTPKGLLHYDTVRFDAILKYKHGCLGKPQRIVLWKEYSK